jgi:hypothetical protein
MANYLNVGLTRFLTNGEIWLSVTNEAGPLKQVHHYQDELVFLQDLTKFSRFQGQKCLNYCVANALYGISAVTEVFPRVEVTLQDVVKSSNICVPRPVLEPTSNPMPLSDTVKETDIVS